MLGGELNFREGYVAASLEYVARVALSNISEYEAALREDGLGERVAWYERSLESVIG